MFTLFLCIPQQIGQARNRMSPSLRNRHVEQAADSVSCDEVVTEFEFGDIANVKQVRCWEYRPNVVLHRHQRVQSISVRRFWGMS